jgi:hypothetical protein
MTIVFNNNNKIEERTAEQQQQRYRCRCRCNNMNSYYDLQEVANVLIYLLSLVSKDACFFRRLNCINNKSNNNNNNSNNRQQRPLLELALRLLREIAVTSSSIDDGDGDDDDKDDGDNFDSDSNDDIEPATALIRKIEKNEVSHLILRNVRLFDSSRNSRIHTNMANNLSSSPPPSSSYWNFDEVTFRQAAEALKSNNSIRSISCQYDDYNNNFNNLASLAAGGRRRYYPRMITSSSSSSSTTTATTVSGMHDNHSIIVSTRRRNYMHEQQHRRRQQPVNNNMHSNSNNNNNNYKIVSRQQEHSFIEACICLPRLESLSLTGNNRWRISHLCQILETVKGLKRLTIRDVVVRSKVELYNLQRCLLRLKKQRIVGREAAGIPLEEIDLTIEDQTEWYNNNDNSNSSNRNFRDRKKKQSHYCEESCCSSCSCSWSSSLFDDFLEILIMNIPNLKIISINKSILSRLNILLRPISVDISTTTLIKLAKYTALSKLKLVGLSFERYSIESMCKLLIKQYHKEKNNNRNRNNRRKQHHITHLEFTGCAFNHTVSQSDWNAMFHLIRHDPNIQIIASSVIYHRVHVRQQQPQHRYSYSCSSCDEQIVSNNNNNRYNEKGGSSTIQRPHHDFLFSLRDKDETNRHFYNRGMEIEYILQEAGFFRLLQQKGRRSTIIDWIDVMVKVKDDSIALFYVLRENPALCAVVGVLN